MCCSQIQEQQSNVVTYLPWWIDQLTDLVGMTHLVVARRLPALLFLLMTMCTNASKHKVALAHTQNKPTTVTVKHSKVVIQF
jgi:hypothetical protein